MVSLSALNRTTNESSFEKTSGLQRILCFYFLEHFGLYKFSSQSTHRNFKSFSCWLGRHRNSLSFGQWNSEGFPKDNMCWAQSLGLWRGKITGLGRYYSTLPNKACYQMLSPGCLPGHHTKREWSVGWRKPLFEGNSTRMTHVKEL